MHLEQTAETRPSTWAPDTTLGDHDGALGFSLEKPWLLQQFEEETITWKGIPAPPPLLFKIFVLKVSNIVINTPR